VIISPPGQLLAERIYQNESFVSFKQTLQAFFNDFGIKTPPTTACFAVAGPVDRNSVKLTNRDGWDIVGDDIAATFGIKKVQLINDFVAVGYGLITLDIATDCIVLQAWHSLIFQFLLT
jgi:glucokinase